MALGFIGTGIMGSRMAINLLKNGHDVIVHNRTQANAQPVIDAGATWAETPATVAQQTDIVFTMLAHPNAVESVALGENGLLSALSEGNLWVDCSTVNPMFVRRMAEQASKHGIRYMDAPVAGSKNQAQEAQLVFFVGGADDDVATCQPYFEAMSKAVNHVGGVSMGTSLKLVINHLLATSMLAFAEGLALGESLGIDRETLLNTIVGGPVAPPYLAGKRAKIASDTYETEFPLRWMQKDTAMVAETAFDAGVAMPSANITKEIFQLATRFGYGDDDFSAIYAFLTHSEE
ncbi:MAG: NAD(P)-dependent oxidoreductase [Chloroflexota bacterium]